MSATELRALTYHRPVGKQLTYNATIVERRDHTPLLSSFITKYDDGHDGETYFLPGQYVAIGLNNEHKPELGSVRRAMSIASAPEQGDQLEFYIRYVTQPASDNPLTHLLWDATVGDRIFVSRKPVGKFTLADTIGTSGSTGRLKLLIAAGTGIAPFVSMIRSRRLSEPTASLSDVILLHGASYPADLCYKEELERARQECGLHYFPTVSRPGEASDWKGARGRVEDFFLPDRFEALERATKLGVGELAPARAGALVCGLQGTIARCIERLADRGFIPHDRKIREAAGIGAKTEASLWWEQYDNDPVLDLENETVRGELRAKFARTYPVQ